MRCLSRSISIAGLILLGLAVFWFLLQPITAAQQSTVDPLYRDAIEADDRGDLPRAISLYQALLQSHPESIEVRTNLGVALGKLARYRDAEMQYREALKRDPKNLVVRLDLSLLWYKQAEYQKAANELAAINRDSPEHLQALYLLADCYLRLGKYSEAVALLTPVYRSHPEDRAVDYALGTALIRAGKIAEGEAVIDLILKDGNSAAASLLLGESQLVAGDSKAAAANIQIALHLDSNLPGAWSLYGKALLNNLDREGADEAFRRALQIDPNDFAANLYLGGMLRYDRKVTEALPFLQKALRLRPASPEARFQIAASKAAMGDLVHARAEFEKIEKDFPDFLEVHVHLAALYARLNRKEESRREQAIVLKLNARERERKVHPNP